MGMVSIRMGRRREQGESKDVVGYMAGEKDGVGDRILGGMGKKGWR